MELLETYSERGYVLGSGQEARLREDQLVGSGTGRVSGLMVLSLWILSLLASSLVMGSIAIGMVDQICCEVSLIPSRKRREIGLLWRR